MCKRNKTAAPTKEKNYNFQKLTPVQDASIEIYSDALDKIFEEDDIRNIAITGTYGSGKSSVIETYEKQHAEYKFIHLSLAHFDQEDSQNKDSETRKMDIKTIEGQLLNQLVHKIKKRKIPETQFSIKKHRSKWCFGLLSIAISLCVLFFFILSHNEAIMDSVLHIRTEWLKDIFMFFLKPDHIMVRIVPLLLLLFFITYKFLYNMAGRKFIHKLNVQGNEIELFSDQNDSVFDKYLNEILYLFEHSEADAVVFEDIDRFKNTLVFERLREINALLCERQKREIGDSTKIIRFFYLIRDDLFKNNDGKDRTKFFDFIIPIVPVVDGNNSYDTLYTLFSEARENVWDKFNTRFLRRVCIFIDDYRMLKNIYNEFMIYRKKLKLNESELDYNKLFAIIVYKNVFPRDFAELQIKRGFVYALLVGKEKIVKAYNARLDEEINKINKEIERNKAEEDKEIDKLNSNFDSDMDDNGEKYLKKLSLHNKMVAGVHERNNKIVNIMQSRITEKQKHKLLKPYYCARDLIDIDNIEDFVKEGQEAFQHIKNHPYYRLLTYLLRSGYIDETYFEYLSIFYPDSSLTVKDKLFIRNVLERKEIRTLGYDYHLDSPEMVLDYLEDYDFTHSAILNYDLFDHMLTEETSPEMKNLIQVIIKTKNYQFIQGYLHLQRKVDKVIDIVTNRGVDMYWLYKSKMEPGMLRRFMYEALKANSFKKNESDNYRDLKDYISHQLTYIDNQVFRQQAEEGEEPVGDETEGQNEPEFTMGDREKIRKGICDLGVQFVEINGDAISNECIEFVYKSNLYEINPANIMLMVEKYSGKKCDNDFLSEFMSYVLNQNEQYCKYMSQELNRSMTVYLNMYDGKISDPSNTIIEILNHNKVDENNKKEYIKRLITKVEKLKQVKEREYQKLLLQNGAVEYTGDNMLDYIDLNGMDETLITFVNSDDSDIVFSKHIDKMEAIRFGEKLKLRNINKIYRYEGE